MVCWQYDNAQARKSDPGRGFSGACGGADLWRSAGRYFALEGRAIAKVASIRCAGAADRPPTPATPGALLCVTYATVCREDGWMSSASPIRVTCAMVSIDEEQKALLQCAPLHTFSGTAKPNCRKGDVSIELQELTSNVPRLRSGSHREDRERQRKLSILNGKMPGSILQARVYPSGAHLRLAAFWAPIDSKALL